jgi:hypothetical protein
MSVVAIPAEATKKWQGVRFNWARLAKARRATVEIINHQRRK